MEIMEYFHEYFEKLKIIQAILLDYLDSNENQEELNEKLIKSLDDQKIRERKVNLKIILHLIAAISSNHYQTTNFYDKIFQILRVFFNEIQKYYTKFEIFNIFKKNKRILLFLFENNIITPNELIASIISNEKYTRTFYTQYFYPEFDHIFSSQKKEEIILHPKLIENDFQLLKNGRKIVNNYNLIQKLIIKDSLNDFISYVNSQNIPLNYIIKKQITQTSFFIIKNEINLIEYAALSGSVQIFKYLVSNKVEIKPFLWLCAIHGNNSEIIHILEDLRIQPPDNNFLNCFKEAVKCHHNDFAKYIKNNYLNDEGEIKLTCISQCLKYYNFEMLDEIDFSFDDVLNQDMIYSLIMNEYLEIVDFILQNGNEFVDLNKILNSIFIYSIQKLTYFEYNLQ